MKRFVTLLELDVVLQFRNGFYYAGAFVAVVMIFLLRRFLNPEAVCYIIPVLFLGTLMVTTMYFVAGLVLLEKNEGTLQGLTVTPVRIQEYLWSKVMTLTLLAGIESLLIVFFTCGFRFNLPILVLGILFMSAIYTLTGFIAVARYDSISDFLLPSMLYAIVLELPFFHYFGVWESYLFYLVPTQAPLLLMKAAFSDFSTFEIIYGIVYSLVAVGVLTVIAHGVFRKFVVRSRGERR